jgi:hypothetical protein
MTRRLSTLAAAGWLLAAALAWPELAQAKPGAPLVFCQTYPASPACSTGNAACATCHTSAPQRNVYGTAVAAKLLPGVPRPLGDTAFAEALPAALQAVETADSDNDGHNNVEEILAGSLPADPASKPAFGQCSAAEALVAGHPDQRWNTCARDGRYVFRKMMLDFCGRSPSRAEDQTAALDYAATVPAALATCLQSDFWRGKNGAVWNMANAKIVPQRSIKGGEEGGQIPLGDYFDDYWLFVWSHTGDRDVRDLLTAQYFVRHDEDGNLHTVTNTPLTEYVERGILGAQIVPIDKRAGLLTSRWFLVAQTMFTPLPRTSAAQAYRAYLGYDIAKMEGLQSVDAEPKEHDRKGVTQSACAACHATLDPLSYPFSRYDGIGGGVGAIGGSGGIKYTGNGELIGEGGNLNVPFANYVPDRLGRFVKYEGPQIVDIPEEGVIFGQKVKNLLEWAQVAANSEAFARAVVMDYWKLLMGEPPRPADMVEFDRLWRDLMTVHEYRVERMLAALVQTEAYGIP